MSLRDRAREIILQKDHTDEDIVELSRISYDMSLNYYKARIIVWKLEWEYNKARPEKTLESKETGKTMWFAEQTGKLYAECKYWDYRKIYQDCVGMSTVIEQINAFRFAYYRLAKGVEAVT